MGNSPSFLDHFHHPRNVGAFEKDDPDVGTALVRSRECSDLIKLQIRIDPQRGTITAARFKTFGCSAAIASGSLATEWLKGRTLQEALEIGDEAIVRELDLPAEKIHCAVLAKEAIELAVREYQARRP